MCVNLWMSKRKKDKPPDFLPNIKARKDFFCTFFHLSVIHQLFMVIKPVEDVANSAALPHLAHHFVSMNAYKHIHVFSEQTLLNLQWHMVRSI